ncbi:11574_t:CDS:1, partial [Racocetra persica]
ITQISAENQKLTGDLIVEDYPNLQEINLPNQELTSLIVINCPKLQIIKVRNNQLAKLEIQGANQVSEIIAGGNELTTLNLANCSQISKLMVADNPYLTKLENLNWATLKNINIANTGVALAEENEELKARKEEVLEKIKTLKEAAEEKELVLTEPIQTPEQAEEAILRHLKKTGEK